MTVEEMYDKLVALGISEDFINGAVWECGWNKETMEEILYYFLGYRSFEQLEEW